MQLKAIHNSTCRSHVPRHPCFLSCFWYSCRLVSSSQPLPFGLLKYLPSLWSFPAECLPSPVSPFLEWRPQLRPLVPPLCNAQWSFDYNPLCLLENLIVMRRSRKRTLTLTCRRTRKRRTVTMICRRTRRRTLTMTCWWTMTARRRRMMTMRMTTRRKRTNHHLPVP